MHLPPSSKALITSFATALTDLGSFHIGCVMPRSTPTLILTLRNIHEWLVATGNQGLGRVDFNIGNSKIATAAKNIFKL